MDVGGTSVKAGAVNAAGKVVRRASFPTGSTLTGDELVEGLAGLMATLTDTDAVRGVGVAMPGMRRDDGEGVVNVTNLPHLDGFPLRSELEQRLRLPVVVENDANAAALGEYRFGGVDPDRRLLLLTLGTGIGAGMVVDGEVLRISWQGLGDPGHVNVRPGGPRCGCGAHGCLEVLAATPAIRRRARHLGHRGPSDLNGLAAMARTGAGPARQAFGEAAELIGVGLATLVHLLAPTEIRVGGGGIAAAEDLLLPGISKSLRHHVQPFLGERLTIGRAALGNDAGMLGAVAPFITGSHPGPCSD